MLSHGTKGGQWTAVIVSFVFWVRWSSSEASGLGAHVVPRAWGLAPADGGWDWDKILYLCAEQGNTSEVVHGFKSVPIHTMRTTNLCHMSARELRSVTNSGETLHEVGTVSTGKLHFGATVKAQGLDPWSWSAFLAFTLLYEQWKTQNSD